MINQKEFNSYHSKYCCCCGLKSKTILNHLLKSKKIKKCRKWNKHTLYDNNNYFYDSNYLKYCGNCGVVLDNKDIYANREFMGYFGSSKAYDDIITGYKCSICGYEEKF